jgi:hypothetical protein
MAKRWRQIFNTLEADAARRKEEEILHPPITRLTPEEANNHRQIKLVGKHCIECNLPCNGEHIPPVYHQTKPGTHDVLKFGIQVEGYESYYVILCAVAKLGRVCLTTDETLKNFGSNF